MKTGIAPRVGAVDALATGLNLTGRRPWLMLVPVLVDLGLWLGPRLSVADLFARLVAAWEALVNTVYSAAQQATLADMLSLFRETATEVGRQTNLATAIGGGWLAPSSTLATVQGNRLLLISDGVLAPVGLGLTLRSVAPPPWAPTFEIESVGLAVLLVVGLWLIGQVIATLYLRWVALSLAASPEVVPGTDKTGGAFSVAPSRFSTLYLRFTVLSLLVAFCLLLLRAPLALVTALAIASSSSAAAFIFVLSGGLTLWLTLWFLASLFFASDVILVEGRSLWFSLWRSLVLVRANGLRVLGFVALINLLSLGARAIWGLIGQTPLGALAAILGNGYLVTGIVLAVFVYFDGLRRPAQPRA